MASEIRDKNVLRLVDSLSARLRRRQVTGAHQTAMETTILVRQVVATARFTSLDNLVVLLKAVGRQLADAQPKEHTVGNVVRRILRLIREEWAAAQEGIDSEAPTRPVTPDRTPPPSTPLIQSVPQSPSALPRSPPSAIPPNIRVLQHRSSQYSLANFVLHGKPHRDGLSSRSSDVGSTDGNIKKVQGIKPALIQAIQEVIDELETVYDNVSKTAKDHIHSDEIVLTLGMSRTVESFLKQAAAARKFTVIVAETAPSYSGHEMAKSLSEAGVNTILIPDSSIYAVMSRVNKVVLGAHSILANGGIFADNGALLAGQAARMHRTPIVICTGQYKVSPLWNVFHAYGSLDFAHPGQALGFDDGALMDQVDILNPTYDYVPPENIDVFITNDGDLPPTAMNRLVKDMYDDADYQL